ncbi:MAG: putative toxin-antitoxin system toxin component, PIN family [Candidatus Levybacteria bacterium CG_4_10_14_0_2_um_filter_36_16]|nr:MAG: putative toxin-antitoxin system toxin component, PIN family [Candidatus Levybacteria bacterium CG2_30_37_29]PIR78752.1 MAG: putative toxin-antitoxin system toxin component, PIN family [Candidatus Levybacteria bacterium CG10_big_fil_rev_8_21_14_0_10_36_30]PIZ96168.1 MAG: putative toxin-antitoxin system toxin component, PIN family [Candidatus Levybacteria bacterium CG_4_10_14_0_2_um_filter_36_16]PJA90546.1 MAG: putative toxin-antitoxin system toxin component, PIN family [Candidatus Levybac
MRVYFDASVIIAGFLSSIGGSAQLFWLLQKKVLKGITSQTVIDEVLEEDKPTKLKRTKEEIENFIVRSEILVREAIPLEEIRKYEELVDPEDSHLIAGANLTHCEYLVTLDKKHLLRDDIQKKFLPLKIVSPKELLSKIVRN